MYQPTIRPFAFYSIVLLVFTDAINDFLLPKMVTIHSTTFYFVSMRSLKTTFCYSLLSFSKPKANHFILSEGYTI